MKTINTILTTILVLCIHILAQAQGIEQTIVTHRPFYFNRDAVWKNGAPLPTVKTDSTGCPCDSEWSPIHQLSPNKSMYLQMASQGDDIVHCIWMENNSPLGIRQIKYARSVNVGKLIEPTRDIIMDSSLLRRGVDGINIVTNDRNVYIFCVDGQSQTYYSSIWMMRSLDSGQHWASPQAINVAKDSADNIRCASASGDTLALLYTSKKLKDKFTILYSTNAGDTWKQTKMKLPKGEEYRFAITPKYFHLLYVKYGKKNYVGGEVIYRNSKNFGKSWGKEYVLSTPDSNSSFSASIATARNGSVYVTWLDGKYGSINGWGLTAIERHTYDNGKTWSPEKVITPLGEASWPYAPYQRQIDSEIKEGGALGLVWDLNISPGLTAFQVKSRILISGDSGWCPEFNVTPNSNYAGSSTLSVTSTQMVIGWQERVQTSPSLFCHFIRSIPIKMRKKTRESTNSQQTNPLMIELEQNYPNPFNPVTVIRYSLPVNSIVTLKIYDVIGREVITVLQDEENTVGVQEVEFNASNIASGIYYYRLDVQSEEGKRYSETKKLTVVK